ncbi:MAG: hypothetical protein ABI867_37270 [Kofleriaceae bacterium]
MNRRATSTAQARILSQRSNRQSRPSVRYALLLAKHQPVNPDDYDTIPDAPVFEPYE